MNKKKIPWIIGLIILAIWITTNTGNAYAQEEYTGPEVCIDCHTEQYDQWSNTEHAEAYSDPEFQEAWIQEGSPEDCLSCHTTGYDPDTKEYAFEGVTCEECHGPGFTMQVDRSPELCGSCHTGEYGKNRYENYLEGTHAGSDVTCASCHMTESDHSFKIQAETCASCHTGDTIHMSSLITDMQSRALEAEDHVIEIEEELASLEEELAQSETRTEFVSYLTLFGGGALFLVMIIVALSYLRKKQTGP